MRLQFHCIMLINSYNRQNTLFKMTKSVELFGIRLVLYNSDPWDSHFVGIPSVFV